MTGDGGRTVNVRALAMEALLESEKSGAYSHLVLSDVLQKYAYLDKRDRAFLTRLVEGTTEYRLQLDAVIDAYAKTPVKKQKPVIRTILRMGAYQLRYMDGVPASAVCNESVKLAASKGFAGLKGFVNGVLRAIARAQEAGELKADGTCAEEAPADMLSALSVRYSTPRWIVALWAARFEKETLEKMLAAGVSPAPLTVRCQLTNGSVQDCVRMLCADGVQAAVHPYLPYALTLSGVDRLTALRAFSEGRLTVQDVGSMLAVYAAAPQKGDTVIDVCAAPGGKSFHAADLVGDTGVVCARDVSAYKTARIEEGARRLGCKNMVIQVRDACIFCEEDEETADIVLVDAPCSGLGVLARKKDLRYRVQETDIGALAALQQRILRVAQRYVRPGGVLMYSTCTVSRAENEDNARWFAENYPFALEDLTPHLPEALVRKPMARQGYVQLLPGVHACDGFFLARFRKTE